MLRPPSLQDTHLVCYSRDPGLMLPDISTLEGEEAQLAAWLDWDRRFTQARELGKLAELIKPGEQVTVFKLIPMPSTAFRAIRDALQMGKIGDSRARALAFRACLRGIEDAAEKIDIEFVNDPEYGRLATAAIVDRFDAITPWIVHEIGKYAFERADAPPPKR